MVPEPPPQSAEPDISNRLRAFHDEMPYERWPILRFVERAAAETPAGARVADVGAGTAPYRELFGHTDYCAIDWDKSPHNLEGIDIVASAERIPEPDGSFDSVLLTQVLEHVPDPGAVLREQHRLLRAGGTLYVTAPLVWELHELPHDYYRYTAPGLEHLLADAGFENVEVAPRNDCFTTLAQLMLNVRWAMGRANDGLDRLRVEAADMLEDMAGRIAKLAPLDREHAFPLGYAARATRTSDG
jgi:SAM-dependent methyltransferase